MRFKFASRVTHQDCIIRPLEVGLGWEFWRLGSHKQEAYRTLSKRSGLHYFILMHNESKSFTFPSACLQISLMNSIQHM